MEELVNFFLLGDNISMYSVVALFVLLCAIELVFNMIYLAKEVSR